MKETFTLTAIVNRRGEYYEALCPEMDIASRGEIIEEAVTNLKETVELYLEKEDADYPVKRPFITTFEVTVQRRKMKKHRKESL